MHEHGPDELIGPLRGTAAWWRGMGAQPVPTTEGPPAPEKMKKKRRSPNSPRIRQDLVDRVRREIAAGTYDTDVKWEAALDRLLNHLETDF
jgi:hypothetical protein